ncbi:MAG: glycosyltransferase [Opitutales bacterium]
MKRHPAYLQALTNFNQVLSVSKASLLELKKAIGDTCPPAKVIQLGADYSGIKEGNTCLRKERLEQLGQKVSALMVGIVEPRKNQLAALEAQRILAEQGITLELTIVGRLNDHFGEAIKQKIEKQIREGYPCRYVGAVADSQLDELYTQADVLLFPSIVEGFGLPPFEALARGVPCISHRLPSVFEFLEDAPIIWCDAPTGESLAKGISRFANDLEFRKNFPEKAQSFHLPKWKDTALQIAEITGLSE